MVRRTRDILRSEQGVSIVFAVLLVVVLLMNALSAFAARKLTKK